MKLLMWVAALAVAVSISCSGDKDAGLDGSADGACVPSLEYVAQFGTVCPASFDGSEAGLPSCVAGFRRRVWICGDLIELAFDTALNLYFKSCFYDASSHLLVGAKDFSDGGHPLCGAYPATVEAGRTTPTCRENPPAVDVTCPRTST